MIQDYKQHFDKREMVRDKIEAIRGCNFDVNVIHLLPLLIQLDKIFYSGHVK